MHRTPLRVSDLPSAVQKWPSCEPDFGLFQRYNFINVYSSRESAGQSVIQLLMLHRTPRVTACVLRQGSHEGHFCTVRDGRLTRRRVLRRISGPDHAGRASGPARNPHGPYLPARQPPRLMSLRNRSSICRSTSRSTWRSTAPSGLAPSCPVRPSSCMTSISMSCPMRRSMRSASRSSRHASAAAMPRSWPASRGRAASPARSASRSPSTSSST